MNKEPKRRKQLLQEYNESIEEEEKEKEIMCYVNQSGVVRPTKDIPFEKYYQNEIESETVLSCPDCGSNYKLDENLDLKPVETWERIGENEKT